MQITINVPDEHIHGALAAPHSRYWALSGTWDAKTCKGCVVEACEGGDGRADSKAYDLNRLKLADALRLMFEKNPRKFGELAGGYYDGSTGDVLLQFMAFGELRYG